MISAEVWVMMALIFWRTLIFMTCLHSTIALGYLLRAQEVFRASDLTFLHASDKYKAAFSTLHIFLILWSSEAWWATTRVLSETSPYFPPPPTLPIFLMTLTLKVGCFYCCCTSDEGLDSERRARSITEKKVNMGGIVERRARTFSPQREKLRLLRWQQRRLTAK